MCVFCWNSFYKTRLDRLFLKKRLEGIQTLGRLESVADGVGERGFIDGNVVEEEGDFGMSETRCDIDFPSSVGS